MPELVEYPFPLSDGTIAFLSLPANFTESDAERLVQMVQAVVVPEEHTEENNDGR